MRALNSPDTGASSTSYDEAGNPTLKSDARSKTGTLTFDALNRPISVSYLSLSVTFGYDAGHGVGKLTSMTDSSGSTAWTYDKLGRVTQKTQTTSAVTLTTSYTYLAGGRVATMTHPSGAVVGFTYDGANVASITVNGVTVVSGVTYFPFGGPKGWTMGSIGTYSRQMDVHGRITSHTSEYRTRILTWDVSSGLTNVAETGLTDLIYFDQSEARIGGLNMVGHTLVEDSDVNDGHGGLVKSGTVYRVAKASCRRTYSAAVWRALLRQIAMKSLLPLLARE